MFLCSAVILGVHLLVTLNFDFYLICSVVRGM